jgi:hypothetical protein
LLFWLSGGARFDEEEKSLEGNAMSEEEYKSGNVISEEEDSEW